MTPHEKWPGYAMLISIDKKWAGFHFTRYPRPRATVWAIFLGFISIEWLCISLQEAMIYAAAKALASERGAATTNPKTK